MNGFFKWWREVGSGMRPMKNEDTEEFARRIAHASYIEARRAEFICTKCGLRKDGEHDQPVTF